MTPQTIVRLPFFLMFVLIAFLIRSDTQVLSAQSSLSLYDDFNNPAYNGMYNPILWNYGGVNFFQVRQMNGSMVFSNTTAPSSGDGVLIMRQPSQRSLLQTQQFEARLKVSSDHIGTYAFVKIQISSNNINGHGWWTQCRLGAWSGGSQPQFICDVYTYSGSTFYAEYVSSPVAVSYDTWYTARIEADPTSANLRFYLNGTQVGSHVPNDASALIVTKTLEPRVGVWGDANTYATRYVDDVRITSVGSSSIVGEARQDIGMPYDTNRGCSSPYNGCSGPYHGFYNGVCTDLVMDAYNFGAPFNIQNALEQDSIVNPGRYRYRSARNAEDMRRYFSNNQQLLAHNQAYRAGDIAFFDWGGDNITDHVLIVSQVDGNGRPLAMVDASGSYSGNPSGRAFEHNWSDYYDQHIQGHGRLIGAGAPATRLQTAEPLQVFRVTLDTTSAALALIDSHAKFTASTFDENLVASNVEAFIPYIPGGTYANLGTSQIISVTQPLSNTAQYIARITGGAAMTYHLTLETFQEGGLTTTTTFTQTISLGETQGTASQLSAPGGVITFSASSPVTLPNVTVTPTAIQMSGLPSSLASTIVAVSEMSGRQALNNAVVSIGTLTNQAGQTISGSSFIVTPPSFNVAPAGNQNVLLQINVPNVGLGLYLGNMTITSANGSGFLIPLSLKVEALTINLPLITR